MPLLPRPRSYEDLSARYGARVRWLVLVIVSLGGVSAALSTTSFNVAIPSLSRHFALGQDRIQWAITGYMAAMTLAMLPTPWLLDRFGFRRCFLLATLLLGLTGIGGALMDDFTAVVLMRVLHGFAAGVLQPLGPLAVLRLFPPESQGRASGVLSFGIVFAPAVAPVLGGMLLDRFGWQAIFLLNLPFLLIAGVAALYLLPLPRELQKKPFDGRGVALLGIATLAVIEGVTGLHARGVGSLATLGTAALASASIALFVRHGRRTAHPVLNIAVFADRPLAMGALVSFVYGMGIYASTYLIPYFLQTVLGYSATAAGLVLLPAGIVLAISIPIGGRMADRWAPHIISLWGLGLFGLSFLLFYLRSANLHYAELAGFTMLGRLGLALIIPSLSIASLRHLSAHQLGQGSSVITYLRFLGGVIGIAVAAVFIEWRSAVHGPAAAGAAFAESFLLLVAVSALAMLAASRMTPRENQSPKR